MSQHSTEPSTGESSTSPSDVIFPLPRDLSAILTPTSATTASAQPQLSAARANSIAEAVFTFDHLLQNNTTSPAPNPAARSDTTTSSSFIDFDSDSEEAAKLIANSPPGASSISESHCRRPQSAQIQTRQQSYSQNEELLDVFNSTAGDIEWTDFQGSPPALANDESEECDNDEDDDEESSADPNSSLYSRVHQMEAHQELLNNSLCALSSHFAQVQLRITQLIEAKDVPEDRRDQLLQELDAFTRRGIPELMVTAGGGRGATLRRSSSMATSLMADDVFEEEDENQEDDLELYANEDLAEADRGTTRRGLVESSSTEDASRSRRNSASVWPSEEKLERQKSRQKELIGQLKEQLEDLEQYAYETGELAGLPSSMLLERQQAIIEQLTAKLPVLSIEQIDKLTPEQLRSRVDQAVKELVNPVLRKEQLVSQLRTQVADLERFIEFLQKEGHLKRPAKSFSPSKLAQVAQFLKLMKSRQRTGKSKLHSKASEQSSSGALTAVHCDSSLASQLLQNRSTSQGDSSQSTKGGNNLVNQISSMVQVFALTQLGGLVGPPEPPSRRPPFQPSSVPFERNSLKPQTRHWGDLRAQLDLSIASIVDLFERSPPPTHQLKPSKPFTEQVAHLVRKDFSTTLRNLIEHGLVGGGSTSNELAKNGYSARMRASPSPGGQSSAMSLFGLGCFGLLSSVVPSRQPAISRPGHAWEIILYYYELKNGSQYRATPSRALSQSFGLGSVASTLATAKHSLLAAIDEILDSHTRHSRTLDAHFRAFVCVALNQQMLAPWLRLILRHPTLLSECYHKWSYTASTGFDDALRALEKLTSRRFSLPLDLTTRQLQSAMHHAF